MKTSIILPAMRNAGVLTALAAPSFVVYFLVLLAVWPGQMTGDSLTQWLYTLRPCCYTDVHSVVHFWALYGVTRVWNSPAAFLIPQIAFVSLVTALVLYELRRWAVPVWLLAVTAVLFPLFPTNLFVTTVLWIDIPHGALLVMSLYFILRIVREDGAPLYRWPFVAAFAATLVMMAMIRANAVIASVLIAGGVLVFYRTRPMLVAFLVVLVMPYAIREIGYGKRTYPKELRGIVPLHILEAYAAKDRIIRETIPAIEKTAPVALLKQHYNCAFESAFYGHVDRLAVGRNLHDLSRIAAQHVLSDPKVYLRHLACATNLLWDPIGRRYAVIGYPPLEIDDGTPDDSGALAYGIRFDPVLPGLRARLVDLFQWSIDYDHRWLFWRPALALYLTLFAAAVIALMQRRFDLLLIAWPALASTLSLVPFMHAPAYRYQFGVTCIALLLVPLLITAVAKRWVGSSRQRCYRALNAPSR